MSGNDARSRPVTGATPATSDTEAMDRIALTLGCSDSWDGGADYLDEIARIVAATGRPHPGEVFGYERGPQRFRAALRTFKTAARVEAGDPVVADDEALNRIAAHLGSGSPWGPEDLEHVAQMVSNTGRPHPGAVPGASYEAALHRWLDAAPFAGDPEEPTGTLLIKVDDIDRFDNPQEPWTAQAFWQTDSGLSDGVGVGAGASVPAALHALAHDMEARGIHYAPAPPGAPTPPGPDHAQGPGPTSTGAVL